MSELTWDKPHYIVKGENFLPKIYEGDPSAEIPEGFNTVKIVLDGKMTSDLNWKNAREKALHYLEKGYYLFWEMDLGLLDGLTFPLQNQMQYSALCLSIDHFKNGLWTEFFSQTVGVCLYRGTLHNLLRNGDIGTVMEFLNLLTVNTPDSLQLFLQLDLTGVSLEESACLLSKERFDRWHCALKGSQLPVDELTWDGPSPYGYISEKLYPIEDKQPTTIGICLPPIDLPLEPYKDSLRIVLQGLQNSQQLYRIIPESFLITEWDGLDYLVVFSNSLGPQGKRKLQGFCAAGGTVVTVGSLIQLPIEISYHEFCQNVLL